MDRRLFDKKKLVLKVNLIRKIAEKLELINQTKSQLGPSIIERDSEFSKVVTDF